MLIKDMLVFYYESELFKYRSAKALRAEHAAWLKILIISSQFFLLVQNKHALIQHPKH